MRIEILMRRGQLRLSVPLLPVLAQFLLSKLGNLF